MNRVLLTLSFALLGFGLGWGRTDAALLARERLGAGLERRGAEGIVTEVRHYAKTSVFALETLEGTVRVVTLRPSPVAEAMGDSPLARLGDSVRFSCRAGSGLEPGRKDPTCLWGTELYRERGRGIAAFFARVRAAVVASFERLLGQPSAAWASGLLVGDDSALPTNWRDVFKRTGTSHLTAASGQNLIYVLGFVAVISSRVFYDRRARALASVAAVLVFSAVAGAPASALRAAAMYFAGRLATLIGGRPVSSLRALLVAGAALVALNPTLLVFDRGFQLSALAVFGIASFAAPLSQTIFRWLPKAPRRWAGETSAATLATAPLIAWMAGTYSIVALPANLVVSPFIGPITAISAALLAASWLPSPLPDLLARVAGPVIGFPPFILERLSRLPFASVSGNLAALALITTTLVALVLTWLWCRRSY